MYEITNRDRMEFLRGEYVFRTCSKDTDYSLEVKDALAQASQVALQEMTRADRAEARIRQLEMELEEARESAGPPVQLGTLSVR